jgi:hypothetical protein
VVISASLTEFTTLSADRQKWVFDARRARICLCNTTVAIFNENVSINAPSTFSWSIFALATISLIKKCDVDSESKTKSN